MTEERRLVWRARILAAQRSGATRERREQKVLDLLAMEYPNGVSKTSLMKLMKRHGSTSGEGSKEQWLSKVLKEASECLDQTAIKVTTDRAGFRLLKLRPFGVEGGYTFDALRFPFWLEWQTPLPNSLSQCSFRWIDEKECLACDIGKSSWCSSRERMFTPASLPKEIEAKLKKLRD
jgi:hypothetical protein